MQGIERGDGIRRLGNVSRNLFNIVVDNLGLGEFISASGLQVLVVRTNARGRDTSKPVGRVLAIDRLPVFPIEGATVLGNMDFTLPATQAAALAALGDEKPHVVVSARLKSLSPSPLRNGVGRNTRGRFLPQAGI